MVDYKINYERILSCNSVRHLHKLRCFLQDVGDRMTIDNPLPQHFLGVIEQKLGNTLNSQKRFELSETFIEKSPYWQHRFKVLGVDSSS